MIITRLLLALLLLARMVYPDVIVVKRAKAAGGAACSTQKDTVGGTTNDFDVVGADTDYTYVGWQFTAGSNYTLCMTRLRLKKTGSPTFTVKAYIYTNSAGAPGTQVGTESAAFSVSTLTTTEADADFTGMSAALTSGTVYWIVLVATGAPNDFTNFLSVAQISGSHNTKMSATGSGWTDQNTFVDLKFTTFS